MDKNGLTKRYPPPDIFIQEALDCVKESEKEGIILRIMGGMAIYLHSTDFKDLWFCLDRLNSKVFTDIDFMGYKSAIPKIIDFFEKRGYLYNKTFLALYGSKRLIFAGSKVPMVDIFLDKIEMCHKINFINRLEVDCPTIPLSELLLEKLQIVHINEKDIKDVIVLLRAHDLGENDNDLINVRHIAHLLSKDWGFYYTALTNLQKIRNFLFKYSCLTEKDRSDVENKIKKIIDRIEKEPKSISWKMRAIIGARKKWYADVEEIVR